MLYARTGWSTRVGRRDGNEDSCIIAARGGGGALALTDDVPFDLLLAVADGMGGGPYGELASGTVVSFLKAIFVDGQYQLWVQARGLADADPLTLLKDVVRFANKELIKAANARAVTKIGATADIVLVKDRTYYFAHAGNCRIYLMSGNVFRQLTRDHTIGSAIKERGVPVTAASKPNAVYNMLGVHPAFDIDVGEGTIGEGDLLILTTDGVNALVPEDYAHHLSAHREDITAVAHGLTGDGVRRGGDRADNATIVMAQFGIRKPSAAVQSEPVVHVEGPRTPGGDMLVREFMEGLRRGRASVEAHMRDLEAQNPQIRLAMRRPAHEERCCTQVFEPEGGVGSIALQYLTGEKRGQFEPLVVHDPVSGVPRKVKVGRDQKCGPDIALPWDQSVSNPHCELSVDDEGYSVFDLNSGNGTLIKKAAQAEWQRAFGRVRVADGDVLKIGSTVFRVVVTEQATVGLPGGDEGYARDLKRERTVAPAGDTVSEDVELARPKSKLSDENVQFTVYRPHVIQPGKWYPMLAFAHLSNRRPDADMSDPEPVEEVIRQAKQVLGEQLKEFRDVTQDSQQAVPREGEITFVPNMPSITFNPRRRTFCWEEDVHREEFRFRADSELRGKTARGYLTVFLGIIIIAEIPLAVRVDDDCGEREQSLPTMERSSQAPHRKVFVSYSHKDAWVVEQFERYALALGDRYLRDVSELRTGEAWSQRLAELIADADVFQLLWSRNSMRSPHVRREWECALALNRVSFVRPTYWEVPLPEAPEQGLPPDELRRLHFQRICVSGSKVAGIRFQTLPKEGERRALGVAPVTPSSAAASHRSGIPSLSAPPPSTPVADVSWHFLHDSIEYGPVSDETLVTAADQGFLLPTDQVCQSDQCEWVVARDVLRLFPEGYQWPTLDPQGGMLSPEGREAKPIGVLAGVSNTAAEVGDDLDNSVASLADANRDGAEDLAAVVGGRAVAHFASGKPSGAFRADDVTIGIDLGNTVCSMAYAEDSHRVWIIPNAEGDPTTPSTVDLSESPPIVGMAAVEREGGGGDGIVRFFRRYVGSDWVFQVGDDEWTALQLSGLILKKLKADAEAVLGQTVSRAVIGIPAYTMESQKRVFMEAARLAGFDDAVLISEPVATTLAYAAKRPVADGLYLIYNLAATTFDVALVDFSPDHLNVVAIDGDNYLGTGDWVHYIAAWISERDEPVAACHKDDMVRVAELHRRAELVSEAMYARDEVHFARSDGAEVTFTRRDFDELTSCVLARTRPICDRLMEREGLSWRDLAGVLLGGEAARIPAVAGFVHDFSGVEPVEPIAQAIALGASVSAARPDCHSLDSLPAWPAKSTFQTAPLSEDDARLRVVDSLVLNVSDRTARIEFCVGDLMTMDKDQEVDVLVVSAYPDDYTPLPGSLLAALDSAGIRVADLARDKDVDLRKSFSCWMSRELARKGNTPPHFRRILCFEPCLRGTPPALVGDIFRSLAPFVGGDPPVRSVAMPIVASGYQRVDREQMLIRILEAAAHWLGVGLPLSCLKIACLPGPHVSRLKEVFADLKQSFRGAAAPGTREAQYDVFISYAHIDAREMELLESALLSRSPDMRVFLDRKDLNPGTAWQQEIFETLDHCRKIIALLSPSYLDSKVCLEEFNIGLCRNRENSDRILVPLYLYSAQLPTYMKLIQAWDCRECDADRIGHACESLIGELSTGGSSPRSEGYAE